MKLVFLELLDCCFCLIFVETLGSTLDLTAVAISVGSMSSVELELVNILVQNIIDNTSYALAA